MKAEVEKCGYWFTVKGRGEVQCQLKKGHVCVYHERRFVTWAARHWPPKRHYFTIVDGARLPKECI